MGSVLLVAIVIFVLAVALGAWGITTDDPADETLGRDEHDISRGRQPGHDISRGRQPGRDT